MVTYEDLIKICTFDAEYPDPGIDFGYTYINNTVTYIRINKIYPQVTKPARRYSLSLPWEIMKTLDKRNGILIMKNVIKKARSILGCPQCNGKGDDYCLCPSCRGSGWGLAFLLQLGKNDFVPLFRVAQVVEMFGDISSLPRARQMPWPFGSKMAMGSQPWQTSRRLTTNRKLFP